MRESVPRLLPVSSSVMRLVRGLFHVKHSGVGGLFTLGGVGLMISAGVATGDGVSPDCRSLDWLSVDCKVSDCADCGRSSASAFVLALNVRNPSRDAAMTVATAMIAMIQGHVLRWCNCESLAVLSSLDHPVSGLVFLPRCRCC